MKEILLLGRGKSNNALREFMNKYEILHDYLDVNEVERFDYQLVIKGPGVFYHHDVLQKFISLNVEIITDVEFIYWFLNREYIAITGTNGKTSTTLLLTDMIKHKYTAIACGNCGFPISQAALDYKLFQYFVLELSSFQLKGCNKFAPKIAIVTNLNVAHLDYHKDVQDYYESKYKITINQTKNDFLILNADDEISLNIYKNSNATKLYFSLNNKKTDCYFKGNKVYFKNKTLFRIKNQSDIMKYNIASAVIAAKLLLIPNKSIKKSIKNFGFLKYRLQEVYKGIYNDAKSTNIYSTISALKEFNNDLFLICGGYDRKEEISGLEKYLTNIKKVFAYGETKEKISLYFKKKKIEVFTFDTLKDATLNALNVRKKEIILYSPMFASYDQYNSFEERGKEFNQIIKKYYDLV